MAMDGSWVRFGTGEEEERRRRGGTPGVGRDLWGREEILCGVGRHMIMGFFSSFFLVREMMSLIMEQNRGAVSIDR